MNHKFQQILQSLIPFMVLGLAVALLIGLFIMFSYVLVWGIFIGGILWIGAIIKSFLFPGKTLPKSEGNIIEHNDRK